jgi:hypothetical protein
MDLTGQTLDRCDAVIAAATISPDPDTIMALIMKAQAEALAFVKKHTAEIDCMAGWLDRTGDMDGLLVIRARWDTVNDCCTPQRRNR